MPSKPSKKKISKSTVIESRVVPATDAAHDAALDILTLQLPTQWVARPDEWWRILQSASERIQVAIDEAVREAKTSPQA